MLDVVFLLGANNIKQTMEVMQTPSKPHTTQIHVAEFVWQHMDSMALTVGLSQMSF